MTEVLAGRDKTESDKVGRRNLQLASALVERFDPMRFGELFVDDKQRGDALAFLAEYCDEVEHNGNYHWQLRAGIRREWLKTNNDPGLLISLLEKIGTTNKDWFEDPFAGFMKIGLSGQRLSDKIDEIETLYRTSNDNEKDHQLREKNKLIRSKQLHALLKAARLIDLLEVETSDGSFRVKDNGEGQYPSEARKIRRQIERNAALDGLDSLANKYSKRLFGRQREIRDLIRFRNTNLVDEKNKALRLCIITGVGGAGKSALLARYIFRQRSRENMPPIIHFDFDRFSLAQDDPLTLTFEFTRQLALYVPELDLQLVQFRSSQHSGNNQTLCEALGKILLKWEGRQSAVTLVIDTFEEIALQGTEAVRKTLLWLEQLRDCAHLENLHIIIAGRAMPDTLTEHKPHIFSRLRLGDLHKTAAQLLLTASGVSVEVADKAVDTFGGNPLVLHMFARFNNSKPQEIKALLSGNRERKRSAPSGELALHFLVDRILVRISDDEVKRLSSPGLTLRFITKNLIKDVLAKPCGLGEITDEKAAELFDKLASHVWLVRQDGDRLLGHHRDLRRMMLPGIKQENRFTCQEIHRLAVDYFESEPVGVVSEEAWIEAAYHRGFLEKNSIPNDMEQARRVITQLGADLLDWPVHAIAMIKRAAQMSERLTKTEEHHVGMMHKYGIWSRAYQASELEQQASLKNGKTTEAELADGLEQANDTETEMAKQGINPSTIPFYFQYGSFSHISPWAAEVLRPLFRQRDALAITHFWQDDRLLHKSPWLIALAVLAEPDYGTEDDPIIPPSTIDAVLSTPRRVAIDTTFELFYMLAIAQLMNDRQAKASLSAFLESYLPGFCPPVSSSAQLQILQLSINSQACANLIGSRDVISVTNCDQLQWRSLMMLFDDDVHPDTKVNRHRIDCVDNLLPKGGERSTLQQLYSMRKALGSQSVEVLGPLGLNHLHSVQPVLYAPIRFALSSVPAQKVYQALDELACQSKFWPIELTPRAEYRDNGVGFSRTQLNIIIETADRCNLLELLLKSVSADGENPFARDELRLLTRLNGQLSSNNELHG